MSNEQEIRPQMQTLPTWLLARAATGAVDLNEEAHAELASRGLNKHGDWVGFESALQEWEDHWS